MSETIADLTWSRNPPDATGYWLRFDDHLMDEELRSKEKVTLHYATSMRDGRVLVDLLGIDGGQPNFTDVTSSTVTCRTSHWWWYGPIPILPEDNG